MREIHELQPIGIYTIPEISFVGQTEDALTTAKDKVSDTVTSAGSAVDESGRHRAG